MRVRRRCQGETLVDFYGQSASGNALRRLPRRGLQVPPGLGALASVGRVK